MKLNHTNEHCKTCSNKDEINVNTDEYFCSTCIFQYTFRTDNYKPIHTSNKIKLLAWFDGEELRYFDKSFTDINKPFGDWKRVPSEDKEIEVEK